jgi:hypothetical protein
MSKHWGLVAAGTFALAAAPIAGAGITPTTLLVQDHPDALQAPPSYGLRLDNIFAPLGGPSGFTTFSFNQFNNTMLTIDNDSITIAGTVYGGHDEGTSWGFGEGAYALAFTYNQNVSTVADGWTAAQSATNTGTLTALGNNNGVPMGTVFQLADMNDPTGLSFLLLQDGHRLTPEQIQGMNDPWVGRGWMTVPDGQGGTRDWIFVAIPAPGTAMGLGMMMAAAGRRRRS